MLGEHRIPQDSVAGRRQLAAAMAERRAGEADMDYKKLRRGWCLGTEAFREELLGQMETRLGAEHYGTERRETAEALAERLVQAELRRLRWRAADLARRAKGDAHKVALAIKLRAETVMTVPWIAARLAMGTAGYVHHLLYCRRKTPRKR